MCQKVLKLVLCIMSAGCYMCAPPKNSSKNSEKERLKEMEAMLIIAEYEEKVSDLMKKQASALGKLMQEENVKFKQLLVYRNNDWRIRLFDLQKSKLQSDEKATRETIQEEYQSFWIEEHKEREGIAQFIAHREAEIAKREADALDKIRKRIEKYAYLDNNNSRKTDQVIQAVYSPIKETEEERERREIAEEIDSLSDHSAEIDGGAAASAGMRSSEPIPASWFRTKTAIEFVKAIDKMGYTITRNKETVLFSGSNGFRHSGHVPHKKTDLAKYWGSLDTALRAVDLLDVDN